MTCTDRFQAIHMLDCFCMLNSVDFTWFSCTTNLILILSIYLLEWFRCCLYRIFNITSIRMNEMQHIHLLLCVEYVTVIDWLLYVYMLIPCVTSAASLHDRKLCVLGLCLLMDTPNTRPQAINEVAHQIVPAMILLFNGLERAYARKLCNIRGSSGT